MARLLALTAVALALAASSVAQVPRLVGRVVDTTGHPLANASVELLRWNTGRTLPLPTDRLATTDDDGRFSFATSALEFGFTWSGVLVRAPKHEPERLRPTPEVVSAGNFGTIALRRGRIAQVFVRDRDGQPIDHALVEIVPAACPSFLGTERFDGRRTDRHGLARFDGAPRGPVSCRISAVGHFTREIRCASEPLIVELERSGFVVGRLLDSQHRPVRASVRAVWRTPQVLGLFDALDTVPTSEDGVFRVGIEERERFWLEGSAIVENSLLTWRSDPLHGPTDGLDLVAAEPETHVIVHGAGRPVDSARIRVVFLPTWFESLELEQQRGFFRSAAAWTLESGEAWIGEPTGVGHETWVEVEADGYVAVVHKLEHGTTTILDLDEAATIEGTITNEDGEPLPHAILGLDRERSPGFPFEPAFSNTRGRFRLSGLDKGRQAPVVRAVGYSPHRIEQLLQAGETRGNLTFRLRRANATSGQIDGADIGPGWQVSIGRADGDGFRAETSPLRVAPDGSFPLPFGLPEGRTLYFSLQRGGVLGEDRLDVESTEIHEGVLHARVPKLATLDGIVRADGVRLDQLAIGLRETTSYSWGYPRVSVASDGSFHALVRPGKYTIAVLDAVSGVLLHETEEQTFESGKNIQDRIELEVARVTLRFERPAGICAIDELYIEQPSDWVYAQPLDLGVCGDEVEILLPRGEFQLHFQQSSADPNGFWGNAAPVPLTIHTTDEIEHVVELPAAN
ncbi:MAG: carboxypeptidase regulatory-like domain-containing protein [Planctomycetes bacterium]|nr:carboxypeptidase regulatory-like domain-containing protein [Planctomycetota bacterium]